MRKAFNFYRSYYDIAKELKPKDRGEFLWAVLQKQFEGIEPELEGMAKFAYVSQKYNIDAQVLGYETKTKTTLAPTVGGTQGGTVQGKGKGEGKEEGKGGKIEFDVFWNLYDKKQGDREACNKKWNALKDVDREKIIATLPNFKASISDKRYQPLPATYLNQKRWNDELTKKEDCPYTILQIKKARMCKETGYALPSFFDNDKWGHVL